MRLQTQTLALIIFIAVVTVSLSSLYIFYKDVSITGEMSNSIFTHKYYVGKTGPLTREAPHILIKEGKIEDINKCLRHLGVLHKRTAVNCFKIPVEKGKTDILCFFKDIGYGDLDWFEGEKVCDPSQLFGERLMKGDSSSEKKTLKNLDGNEEEVRISDRAIRLSSDALSQTAGYRDATTDSTGDQTTSYTGDQTISYTDSTGDQTTSHTDLITTGVETTS